MKLKELVKQTKDLFNKKTKLTALQDQKVKSEVKPGMKILINGNKVL